MNIKKISLYILLTIATIFIASCGENKDEKENTIVIGMELNFPPFEMKDSYGKPYGISKDIADSFGEFMHKKVVIKDMKFEGLIPALKTGKIDMIISSLSITDRRKKSIDFSEPYAMFTMFALTNQDVNLLKMNTPKHRIVVKAGTTAEYIAWQFFPKAQHDIVSDMNAAVLEVLQGKADFTFYDALTIYQYWKKYKGRLYMQEYKGHETPIAAGFRKDEAELRENFNRWLAKAKRDQFFEKEGEKHLKEMKDAFKDKNYNFFFDMHK